MAEIDSARIRGSGPALALVMRGGFALMAQAVVAAGLRLRRHPTPWRAATAWRMVHSSLADLGCLAVLRWQLRPEAFASATPPILFQTTLYLLRGWRLPPLVLAQRVADVTTGVLVALQPQER